MLSDVLEYPVEVPVKLALQSENFYISPSREKAPYYLYVFLIFPQSPYPNGMESFRLKGNILPRTPKKSLQLKSP